MEIKKSEFVISSPKVSKCPNDNKAEYAFIGPFKCRKIQFD